jgi:hypothetical protein
MLFAAARRRHFPPSRDFFEIFTSPLSFRYCALSPMLLPPRRRSRRHERLQCHAIAASADAIFCRQRHAAFIITVDADIVRDAIIFQDFRHCRHYLPARHAASYVRCWSSLLRHFHAHAIDMPPSVAACLPSPPSMPPPLRHDIPRALFIHAIFMPMIFHRCHTPLYY